ncbi:MAG: hypothetical protein JWO89_795, partial [Verrucomicrobiaceae bacterium]|nr:hypothetical protein [Verrucomicrobiaceae bacterium]
MNALLQKANEITRRDFVLRAAKTCLGVTAAPLFLNGRAQAAFDGASKAKQVPTARNMIYLYMSGGMSHLDTFNAQPGTDEAGPVKHIKTSADGVLLSEYLPLTANHMHHVAVVNSLASTQGAHAQGNYYMHTSYTLRSTIKHPCMGAWMSKFQGRNNPSLPSSVVVTNDSKHPGAGFFEAAVSPLMISNPTTGLQNSKRLNHLSEGDFDYRMGLSQKLDSAFRAQYDYSDLRAFGDIYKDAVKIMKSEDLAAFDLNQEPEAMHELYGKDPFNQGCLLARRLVEHGVRFVEVDLNGWDTHTDNFVRVPDQCAKLDQALSALLGDLDKRGILDDTLVVLTTEFGRTPKINGNEG